MKLETVNEGSQVTLELQFLSEAGTPVRPSRIFWKAEDLMSGLVVRDWTEIENPKETINLLVTPQICSIINQDNPCEVKRITVKAEFGPDIIVVQERDIVVANLGGTA